MGVKELPLGIDHDQRILILTHQRTPEQIESYQDIHLEVGGPPKIMVPPNHPILIINIFHYFHQIHFGGFCFPPIFGLTPKYYTKMDGL